GILDLLHLGEVAREQRLQLRLALVVDDARLAFGDVLGIVRERHEATQLSAWSKYAISRGPMASVAAGELGIASAGVLGSSATSSVRLTTPCALAPAMSSCSR